MPYIPDEKNDDIVSHLIALFDEPYHEYWFHFGRFIHSFAKMEAELIYLLRDISGLSKTKAGVLFSGIRNEGARDFINNLLEASGQQERKARLAWPFSQIGVLGTVRNNLVHWGSTASGKDFLVSNADRYPLKPKAFLVTIEDFRKMCNDISFILPLLSYERKNNAMTPDQRDLLVDGLSWQYKPPQPSPPGKMQHQDRSRSSPPRGASLKSQSPRGEDK